MAAARLMGLGMDVSMTSTIALLLWLVALAFRM
jgi:hypothetical protein